MTHENLALADLGWSAFFSSQLDPDDLGAYLPARVAEVHRTQLRVLGAGLDDVIPPFAFQAGEDETYATVGDWVLLDGETRRPHRLLERRSVFKRRAPGPGRSVQLIAANVDTLFIVSSCNHDFNIARLERYLALAREAEVTPVIVLTKADLTDAPEDYRRPAEQVMPGLLVEVVDARDRTSVDCLSGWCASGQTVALVGSSGVGKSTLVNTLTGTTDIETQAIREDDARGRHTTTGRALHRLPTGGWLLDTPGMRELQLTDVRSGIEEVFSDVETLARECRFANCEHNTEPGCAIQEALSSGVLDADRLKHWRKLLAEEAYNSETLAERRQRGREFSKMARNVMKDKDARRGF